MEKAICLVTAVLVVLLLAPAVLAENNTNGFLVPEPNTTNYTIELNGTIESNETMKVNETVEPVKETIEVNETVEPAGRLSGIPVMRKANVMGHHQIRL